jgi:hypothetical protein
MGRCYRRLGILDVIPSLPRLPPKVGCSYCTCHSCQHWVTDCGGCIQAKGALCSVIVSQRDGPAVHSGAPFIRDAPAQGSEPCPSQLNVSKLPLVESTLAKTAPAARISMMARSVAPQRASYMCARPTSPSTNPLVTHGRSIQQGQSQSWGEYLRKPAHPSNALVRLRSAPGQ